MFVSFGVLRLFHSSFKKSKWPEFPVDYLESCDVYVSTLEHFDIVRLEIKVRNNIVVISLIELGRSNSIEKLLLAITSFCIDNNSTKTWQYIENNKFFYQVFSTRIFKPSNTYFNVFFKNLLILMPLKNSAKSSTSLGNSISSLVIDSFVFCFRYL